MMATQGPAAAKQATAVPRPRSPRSGVMRPGAAKRAQAAPHVTAYAAAMIKKRVLEIFNELMAGDAGEGASAAAAVALEKTISELPMSRGASEQ